MEEEFEITYHVDDGYVGQDRPHHLTIRASDVDDMNEKELREMFWEAIQEDFLQRCSPYSDQESSFIEWAKSAQNKLDEALERVVELEHKNSELEQRLKEALISPSRGKRRASTGHVVKEQ